jgi:hypothetical protein
LTEPPHGLEKVLFAADDRALERVDRASDASTNPLDELGRALTVALLPPLGVAVAGMLRLSLAWQAAAVAVVLVAIAVLLAREGRYRAALLDALRGRTFWIPLAALLCATVALVVTGWYGGFADTVVFGGFVAWGLATACRLVGFATAWTRTVFVGLAALATGATFLSLFVVHDGLSGWVLVPLWALTVMSLALIVANEAELEPGRGRLGLPNPGRPGRVMLTFQQWGLSLAVVGMLAFVVASSVSAAKGPPPTDKEFRLGFVSGREVEPPPIAGASREELARRFSPVLEFTPSQLWEPVAVRDFVEASSLHWTNGAQVKPRGSVSMDDLGRECARGVTTPCYELRLGCSAKQSDGTGNCARGAKQGPGLAVGGHAYVRVLPWRTVAGYPRRPGRPAPFGGQTKTLVQYWLFYFYDDWRAQTLYGDLRQTHEGDWEAVTVGLSATEPLFVAYSSHCGGTWRDWADVRLAQPNGKQIRGEWHPMVGVAEGSQANYPEPDEARAPNWARCAGIPSNKASAATFAYNVRDQTGEWRALALPDTGLELVSERDDVMGFPGYWGVNASATFETKLGKEYTLQDGGRGPAGPPYQALWAEPLERIFCAPTWEYDGDRDFESCRERRAREREERGG